MVYEYPAGGCEYEHEHYTTDSNVLYVLSHILPLVV
jgi:hypothetical protein